MSNVLRFFRKKSHRGHTLIEMVVAMSSASFLMVGLGASVLVTTRAFRPESAAAHVRTSAAFVEHDILSDLQLAQGFTERTDKAATFLVPDRDGDGRPEKLRYAWSGTAGQPLTFSYNGAPAINISNNVQAFSFTYQTLAVPGVQLPAEQTGSQILLLVTDSTNATSAELSRRTLLESWNFVVVMKGLNDSTDEIFQIAESSKAVYISGTIEASKFDWATKLAEFSVGIVVEHPELVDDFGFAASASSSSSSQVNVVNNTHYITTGTSTGSNSVCSWPVEMMLLSDSPSTNLNSLATVDSAAPSFSLPGFSIFLVAAAADIPALATIDPQEQLYDGRVAAGRRVFIPWGSEKSDPDYLTKTGQVLTCRAIEWATGLGEESAELKIFGYDQIFASTNSGKKDYQLATKAVLADKAKVTSISAYIGGASDSVRFAIYSDKSGQPDQLLVQSEIGSSAVAMGWVTLPVPATTLASGNYWLAIAFNNKSQAYAYVSSYSNAGERNKAYAAVPNGYISSWGSSNNSYTGARSIYATYEVIK